MTITCFLSLDGVLHRPGTFIDSNGKARVLRMGSEPFEFAQRIAAVAERTDLQFVICSPWLQNVKMLQLREQAPAWMRHRIVGACEQIAELDELQRVRRHTDLWTVVDSYVEAHGITHWLAVDTTEEGWPANAETRQRLVLCDAEEGLGDPNALNSFTDAVTRESDLEGVEYLATFVLSLYDKGPVAVQERWHLNFWLQSPDNASKTLAALFDEVGRSHHKAVIDGRRSHEDIAHFALRALCAARFGIFASATDWLPHYRWNRVRFALERAGQLPIGRSWLRLVVEILGEECRVSRQREEGIVESYWQSLTEEDVGPLAVLKRAATTAVDAERSSCVVTRPR